MEKQDKFLQSVFAVVVVTVLLLSLPLIAMQFTNEVRWGVGDFVVAGALIFTTGLVYVIVLRYATTIIGKVATGLAISTTFLMVWANLAVGLIGAGPHLGNLLYTAVVVVVIFGLYLSRFKPHGLERTMFGAALTLVFIAVIALVAGMQHYPGSSVVEIIGVNGFFALLFIISGLLFRHASLEQSSKNTTTV
jgi:hypothetical protein